MINIAIDGYAGSGKSTIAEMLAKKLGYKMLNTGSIYRALACAYRDLGYLEPNNEDVEKFLKNIDVEVKFIFDEQYVSLVIHNGRIKIRRNFKSFICNFSF